MIVGVRDVDDPEQTFTKSCNSFTQASFGNTPLEQLLAPGSWLLATVKDNVNLMTKSSVIQVTSKVRKTAFVCKTSEVAR